MNLIKFLESLSGEEKAIVYRLLQKENKTDSSLLVSDWLAKYAGDISVRLYNGLCRFSNASSFNPPKGIWEIKKKDFLSQDNVGITSWNEFIKLRGF